MNMKIKSLKIFVALLFVGTAIISSSCTEDLLDQLPQGDLASTEFWRTEADAAFALNGAYAAVRPLFDRDYYFDGMGEYQRTRSGTLSTTDGNLRLGDAYRASNYDPSGHGSGFDKMYRYLYGGVNRTNYVIENVSKMLPTASESSRLNLEAIIGEAKLLRGMVYFRLITMWGDVPYFGYIISSNDEVANITRTPIAQVKDSILADFTYAYEKLPTKSTTLGRAAKPAALAFRGKMHLYWASWKNFGWPELDGFEANTAEAQASYTSAAADFKSVIEEFGLKLFRNGDPGEVGGLGKADVFPNYFYLFLPSSNVEAYRDGEVLFGFTHGGIGTNQGEELMRDVSGRSHEGSQGWVHPRYEIADRYQSTITGDFVEPLIPMASNAPGARTAPRSAINPLSYLNRDYRMKSTIMWDYEMSMGLASRLETGLVPFIYQTWNQNVMIDGVRYTSYNTDGNNSGYVYRKFLRNYGGLGRSEGDLNWPVMRLADVYLMYAEATNEAYGPQEDAIALVNNVRRRGNLPALAVEKTATKEDFFAAIEQERIVELIGEGHRIWDIRRWRALERVWCSPYGTGVWRRDTHGVDRQRYFLNSNERVYEQIYIYRIPPGERDRNPNLSQNRPWL
jgi:starch-binding outer membrane protein, SusD/RagB family